MELERTLQGMRSKGLSMGQISLFSILLVAAPATQAAESISMSATDALNAVIVKVRRDTPACQDATLEKLKGAREALLVAGIYEAPEAIALTQRKVEDAYDNAVAICSTGVRTAIQNFYNNLTKTYGAFAPNKIELSEADRRLIEMRQCWNYKNDWTPVDPTCHGRNGRYPLDKDRLLRILLNIQNDEDRFEQQHAFKRHILQTPERYISAMQLAVLLKQFTYGADRQKVLTLAHGRVLDPENTAQLVQLVSDAPAPPNRSLGGPIAQYGN
ncbi:MAG: DUF4476 domain-containing protein [Myxococcota bacterium]